MSAADREESLRLPTAFRPSNARRLYLTTQWPIAVAYIPLAFLAFGLIGLGTPTAWLGWLLASLLLWGLWRTWIMSVLVSKDHLVIKNPFRSYRLPLDGTLKFEMSLITTVFPSAIAVAVDTNGRKIPMYASGFLSGPEQRRLSTILRIISPREAGEPALPETWGPVR